MSALPLQTLRRSILHRQGLIRPFEDPFDAVRSMVAVQTQYAASLPVAVAVRTKRVKPGWDDRALEADGTLIKSWSLRHTLHAHTIEDHRLVVGTLGAHLYPNYLRFMSRRKDLEWVLSIEAQILDALAQKPLSRRELHERVPELKTIDMVGWGLDVMGLAFRRRVCIIGLGSDQKFCHLSDCPAEPRYGELLRRYLMSYGPATRADFAHWTGLKTPQVLQAFKELGDQVQTIKVDGKSGSYFSLDGLVEDVPDEMPPMRLLAKFDPLILSHRDKTLFIGPDDKAAVFRKAGQVEACVLSKGMTIGTWRIEKKGSKLLFTIDPIRPFTKLEHSRLDTEFARLTKSLGGKEFEIYFV